MSSSEIDALRAALVRARAGRRSYPLALREQVVRLLEAREREGGSAWALAHDLGLALTTVLSWKHAMPAPSPFLPVVVRDDAPSREGLSLVLPGGARVEGLSFDQIVVLCRRVGS